MQIIWSPTALTQLIEIRRYIQRDKPEAARRVAARIAAGVTGLVKHPLLGHLGRKPGTRELTISNTPYIVIYQVSGEHLVVLTVLHGAQQQ